MSAPYKHFRNPMDCSYCQTPIPEGREACPKCGTPSSGLDDVPTQYAGTAGGSPTTSASVWSGSGDTVVPGQVLGGRFSILGPLGGGGMGQVFEALDQELGVTVALKFLHADIAADEGMGQRFRGEVRLAREISHPNVARTFDLGEIEGRRFLSMEYVPGADLRTVLRWAGRIRARELLRVGRDVCAGLQAVHRAGILHGDLKPANVLMDRQGRAKLTDFGLARFAAGTGGHHAGTPAYMAPEQFDAGTDIDERSDLYSLGVMLYEMATGKTPFRGDTLSEWARVHRDEAPIPPRRLQPDLDPALDEVILRCLEKNPDDRFPDLATLDAALDALQKGLPLASLLPEKTWVLQARRRRVLGIIGGSVLLFVLGVVSATVPGPGQSLWARLPLALAPDAAAERVRNIFRDVAGADLPLGRSRVRVSGDMNALRAASAGSGPDRYRPLESGDVPALSYGVVISAPADDEEPSPEWPFPGEPVIRDSRGRPRISLGGPGDVYAELTGRGEVSRLLWWPTSMEERDDPHGLAFRLAGLDPSDFRDSGPVETTVDAEGVVVTRSFERVSPILGESEELKLVYWRRGPPGGGDEADSDALRRAEAAAADAERGLLLEIHRSFDFGAPALSGDFRPVRETRVFVGGMVALGLLGLAALIGTLVYTWRRRAVVVGRSLLLGVGGGSFYLIVAGFIGSISQGEPSISIFLGTLLSGILLGLLLSVLLAATEAAGSTWMPRAMVGWQRFLSKGLRDPQVAVEATLGVGAAGVMLLAAFGWELLRLMLDLPLAIQPAETLPLAAKPLLAPLLLLNQLPWCFFYAFAITGFFALARRLLGNTPTAALLVVILVSASYIAIIESSWDLFHVVFQMGIAIFVLHRWGIISMMAYFFFLSLSVVIPMGLHEGAPFASSTGLALAMQAVVLAGLVGVTLFGLQRHRAQAAGA